jgi:protein-disulfide isomerase
MALPPFQRILSRGIIVPALVCLVSGFGIDKLQAQSPPPAPQALPAIAPVSWALGQPNAPVTIIEYGSLTCGHCAHFALNVLPTIKRTYIDTGRVRYIFRPFPTPPRDLSMAMHMLTLCAGPNRYYGLSDAFFQRQASIFEAARGETGPKGMIFAIAEDHGGLTFAQAEACLRDEGRQDQVIASARAGSSAGVFSTPTFLINNVPYTQHELVDLTTAIDRALASRSAPSQAKAKTKAKKR